MIVEAIRTRDEERQSNTAKYKKAKHVEKPQKDMKHKEFLWFQWRPTKHELHYSAINYAPLNASEEENVSLFVFTKLYLCKSALSWSSYD
jgi:hypothetical protein